MNVIFAKIILKDNEDKIVYKKDLINERFNCEIFINEIRFKNEMKLNKENNIIYIFKDNDYYDLQEMFYNCKLLTSINLSNFNTNNVTDMRYMFYNCSSLTSINLSNFNTNNVTNMSYMFCNCSSLTSINLSNFNCDKIKETNDMEDMFKNCQLLNINNIKYKDFKIRGQLIIDLKL